MAIYKASHLNFALSSLLNHRNQQPHPIFLLSLRAFPLTLEGAAFGGDETTSVSTTCLCGNIGMI